MSRFPPSAHCHLLFHWHATQQQLHNGTIAITGKGDGEGWEQEPRRKGSRQVCFFFLLLLCNSYYLQIDYKRPPYGSKRPRYVFLDHGPQCFQGAGRKRRGQGQGLETVHFFWCLIICATTTSVIVLNHHNENDNGAWDAEAPRAPLTLFFFSYTTTNSTTHQQETTLFEADIRVLGAQDDASVWAQSSIIRTSRNKKAQMTAVVWAMTTFTRARDVSDTSRAQVSLLFVSQNY